MARKLGAPISRGWVSDVEQVSSLLSSDQPMSESSLYSLLRGEGWEHDRIVKAINRAQADNEIRWVAFSGWCAGGRP